jgi:hypothetical protein
VAAEAKINAVVEQRAKAKIATQTAEMEKT